MDWFRWHHGSVNDPKFQLVAKKADCSVAEVIAVWACLLEAASMAEERGKPGEPDFEAMECALGLADGLGPTIYAAMKARDLVGDSDVICAWEKRQPRREREDNSAGRVAAYRKRHVTPEIHDVTPCNASDNQETPRLDKRREEVTTLPPQAAKKGSRLPLDWRLPAEWETWCRAARPDLDPSSTADAFADYWRSKPGKDGCKLDWHATWRNWCRNARSAPKGSPKISLAAGGI